MLVYQRVTHVKSQCLELHLKNPIHVTHRFPTGLAFFQSIGLAHGDLKCLDETVSEKTHDDRFVVPVISKKGVTEVKCYFCIQHSQITSPKNIHHLHSFALYGPK